MAIIPLILRTFMGLSPGSRMNPGRGHGAEKSVDIFRGGGIEKDLEVICAKILKQFEKIGICVISQDLLAEKLPFDDESIDAVTSFHSIEHWHHSPRQLFGEISRVLKPNGFLIIGCPNAVNLRKRLWVLLGKTNICSLDEWYYEGDPVFHGHVREPTIQELKRLLEWNGFVVKRIAGRNFIGGGKSCDGQCTTPSPNYLSALPVCFGSNFTSVANLMF